MEDSFNPTMWMETAIHTQLRAQKLMDLDFMIGNHAIDEVSVLFKSVDKQERFVGWAMAKGWRLLGTVESDEMVPTSAPPSAEPFGVRFDFLQLPGVHWRVECVCVLTGVSPLHDPLEEGSVAHASYKLPDELTYENHCRNLQHFNQLALPLQAEYRNTYGRFSYFGSRAPYFKPRVNLRDR